ncbi:MFS transporter [Scleromatobacter humisilvae]|uniref:MFS transporter n=1 Tax=Scleromatobacter humisilvae TaxID=2897159 RepID=A0A9X2C2M6_9BURK|nr:MFS transporter [Scleromatobacter humisilvae]MCK9688861.1 MFS transporter [Scleromatobacter humisilvae]
MNQPGVLQDRPHLWAFLVGCIAVTAGVAMHLPMFWMGRFNHFHLAEMPMDGGMLWGMALIVGGILVAGYGLLPRDAMHPVHADALLQIAAPEDAPLGAAHWRLMVVLTVALVIDVMKPASLGFVLPGMRAEYVVSKATVAWLPFAALSGTVVGSVIWGWLADIYGRRASILLSAVMFVGTAICGSMPNFWWNVGMCFLMGAAAGGMLPVTYALLAETMPSRERGWVLVLVGGLGAVGGYLAASGCAAWLEPIFSWRILWFLNLPTGLLLIFLNAFIPESPKYLAARGRIAEAIRTLRGFGCDVHAEPKAPAPPAAPGANAHMTHELAGRTWALSIAAVAWGLINFGLLLWMPIHLVEKGYSMAVSSRLLSASALIAIPTVFVAAFLYSRWSSKGALLGSIGVTALGLAGVMLLEFAPAGTMSPVGPIALLIVGINAIIAMLLPYAAESYPLAVRGRATGWIAACTKGGGLVAQLLSLLALVPGLFMAAMAILVPVGLSLVLVWRFGAETRGRDLRDFEAG